MERLTIEYCGEYVPKELCSIDRLGGADDCDLCFEYCKATEEGNEGCKGCAICKCFNKLGEYEDLEEQGKLLKLPCAVGNDVWYFSERVEKQGRKKVTVLFVEKGTVDNIQIGSLMVPQITVCNEDNVWTTFDGLEDFGKVVFLTREAAEAALKKKRGEVWKH